MPRKKNETSPNGMGSFTGKRMGKCKPSPSNNSDTHDINRPGTRPKLKIGKRSTKICE